MLSAETHRGNREASGGESYGRFLYNRFRYYDPSIGRYISADPLGQLAEIHVYRYAYNNPITWYDPLGLNNFGGPVFQSTNPNAPLFRPPGPPTAPEQAVGAVGDFVGNYMDMREANTIGADRYFHCKANCEAAKRGTQRRTRGVRRKHQGRSAAGVPS